MGNSASKTGANVSRVARAMTKADPKGKAPTAGTLRSSGEGDAVKNFKPTKVVEMSRPEARAAAKTMYDHQIPEMNPDVLRQAMELGPAEKTATTRQKLVPDDSELVVSKAPRPLPMDRSRVPTTANEVEETKGLLTQTQLAEVLKRLVPPSEISSPELKQSVVGDFHISEDSAAILARYYRAPDVRMYDDVMTARWRWKSTTDMTRKAVEILPQEAGGVSKS